MAVIEINNITKEYRLGQVVNIRDSLTRGFARLRGRATTPGRKILKALDGVDFRVEAGEVLGIIGQNGAGKSTLLKLLAGITKSTKGTVRVVGKVAPLIEVGSGLVGDLTGRENIYLNGVILGLTLGEIRKKIDEIIAFAELEEFIDTPVKRYSSGMSVRLGFSIATSVNADILIVDEVLAVGDLAFQRKCFDRMESLIKREGKTVLLVSHNIRQVARLCSRAILMDHGKIVADGSPTEICELFYQRSNKKIAQQHAGVQGQNMIKTGEVELISLEILDEEGVSNPEPSMGAPVILRGVFKFVASMENPEIVFGIHTTDFFYISSMGTAHLEHEILLIPGIHTVDCCLSTLPLVPGTYCLRVGVLDKYRRVVFYGEMLRTFTVKSPDIGITKMPAGIVHIPARWTFQLVKRQTETVHYDASSLMPAMGMKTNADR